MLQSFFDESMNFCTSLGDVGDGFINQGLFMLQSFFDESMNFCTSFGDVGDGFIIALCYSLTFIQSLITDRYNISK